MIRTLAIASAAACLATPSFAEVTAKTDAGFTLTYEVPVVAPADAVLTALGRPAAWWSSAHTYSGDAANITLDLRPGGCWCEALPGGGVRHGEVVLVWPGQRLIRVDAPFGPLQIMGANAVLTMSWADTPNAETRQLKWTFVANGPGVGPMAEVIDGVMGEQFTRLTAHLAGTPAP
jgi:hypothetical protein